MDLVEPHQNRNQIREKIFPFIIELTVTLPQCSGMEMFNIHIKIQIIHHNQQQDGNFSDDNKITNLKLIMK